MGGQFEVPLWFVFFSGGDKYHFADSFGCDEEIRVFFENSGPGYTVGRSRGTDSVSTPV